MDDLFGSLIGIILVSLFSIWFFGNLDEEHDEQLQIIKKSDYKVYELCKEYNNKYYCFNELENENK